MLLVMISYGASLHVKMTCAESIVSRRHQVGVVVTRGRSPVDPVQCSDIYVRQQHQLAPIPKGIRPTLLQPSRPEAALLVIATRRWTLGRCWSNERGDTDQTRRVASAFFGIAKQYLA